MPKLFRWRFLPLLLLIVGNIVNRFSPLYFDAHYATGKIEFAPVPEFNGSAIPWIGEFENGDN